MCRRFMRIPFCQLLVIPYGYALWVCVFRTSDIVANSPQSNSAAMSRCTEQNFFSTHGVQQTKGKCQTGSVAVTNDKVLCILPYRIIMSRPSDLRRIMSHTQSASTIFSVPDPSGDGTIKERINGTPTHRIRLWRRSRYVVLLSKM